MFGFAKKLVSQIETQATNYLNVSSSSDDGQTENLSGLRVLNVEKDSIGSKYGFEAWFDFIVGVNGHPITSFLVQEVADSNPYTDNSNNISFNNLLNYLNHEVNQSKSDLKFLVFSAKGNIQREIIIPNFEFTDHKDELDEITIPTKSLSTSDQHKVENSFFKRLNITLQLTNISAAYSVWHILKVHPNSPGYMAGLIPVSDYIIGAENGVLITGGEDLLGRVINSVFQKWKIKRLEAQRQNSGVYQDQLNNNPYLPSPINDTNTSSEEDKLPSIVLYVYNHDFDVVRPVTIHPNDQWGGNGLLGCDVGYGLLHRLPEVIGKFTAYNPSSSNSNDASLLQSPQTEQTSGNPYASSNDQFDIAPGSVLFDMNNTGDSTNMLKPMLNAPLFAQSELEKPAIGAHQQRKKKSQHHTGNLNTNDVTSYMEEATAQSQKIDGNRTPVNLGDVPPPPKFSR